MKLNKTIAQRVALAAALTFAFTAAQAGTDTDFADVSDKLKAWATGSLGKTFSIGSFVIGLGAGIAKQSLMAAAVGIGTGLVSAYGPPAIDKLMTATI
jgi:conjugal transfer pilus assembly protein TraA